MVERREEDGWLDSEEAGPEVRALVTRLRAGGPEPQARARIEAMVASSIAAPAATVSIAGATKAGLSLWKTIGVAIATAGVGGAIYVALPSDRPEPRPEPARVPAPSEPRERAEAPVEEAAPEPPIEVAPPPEEPAPIRERIAPVGAPLVERPIETETAPIETGPAESPSIAATGEPPEAPALDEAALLARARRTIRQNPGAALDDLHLHARSFPGGILGPERDVLTIEALLRTGRTAEARRIADRFRTSDPTSAHIRRIDYLFRTLGGSQ
jgi:hypothetical protein